MSGDFFGLADDEFYAIPDNITTVVDVSLLLAEIVLTFADEGSAW
jgi:hypothetical protein